MKMIFKAIIILEPETGNNLDILQPKNGQRKFGKFTQ